MVPRETFSLVKV